MKWNLPAVNRKTLTKSAISSRIRSPFSYQFFISVVVIVFITVGILSLSNQHYHLYEMCAGWALSLTNALTMIWINRSSRTREGANSVHWGLGVNGIRTLALLSIIYVAYSWNIENFTPFIVATLVGYFCFLFVEIITLHLDTLKPSTSK